MTLLHALGATGPHPGDEAPMDLYGRLAGTWDVANRYLEDGQWRSGTAVWSFGFVLAGRAVQDVMWFVDTDSVGHPVAKTGSTMRLRDGDGWHVVWFSPYGQIVTLIGRAGENGDILQEGSRLDGTPVRWIFTEVTDSSFRWLGYTRRADGEPWDLEQEMLACRRP